ncbi:MBOAT family O-acyltransferase [Wenyingzhuangia aestuarii]|uniref:MBOAT family O-acyltransferase n=1 Tax=Wenyingzhuangia aestuarii TaxID=1647582 RepID=UPI00293BB86E|nr:MBOAT family O-acyltransferase [Wenyingzhuangia aestuarii]NJB83949.1 D-alanyl-lipoteichoic acid acyltransferase DltB (MBOAT superfamily) [Wenyingzhuangia aestuarii]
MFKYYNFFTNSFQDLCSVLGVHLKLSTLNVILPVGISFYTFQTLSYTIDVYRAKLKPTKDFIAFASFVTFFPQLVAGPIERATNLLPQFYKNKKFNFDFAKSGVELIIWGLFKKVVIADSCAVYVDYIFSEYESQNSITLILGAVYFAFQIYGDFSGYTDIAIGTGRLLGFNLLPNFKTPYFSRNIAEFWRRWHISLTTWFKDYIYIPLGGSRGSKRLQVRNVFVIFLISGFWHGANWTYLFWGGLNAIYFIPSMLLNNNRKYTDKIEFSVLSILKMMMTFAITCFAWIFFRANSLTIAFGYIKKIFEFDISNPIKYLSIDRYNIEMIPLITLFLILELIGINKETPLLGKYSYLKTVSVLLLIIMLGVFSNQKDFIYFQF